MVAFSFCVMVLLCYMFCFLSTLVWSWVNLSENIQHPNSQNLSHECSTVCDHIIWWFLEKVLDKNNWIFLYITSPPTTMEILHGQKSLQDAEPGSPGWMLLHRYSVADQVTAWPEIPIVYSEIVQVCTMTPWEVLFKCLFVISRC